MLFFLKCPSLPRPREINLLLVTDTETETFNERVAIHIYYFSSWLVGVKSNIVNMSPNIVKASIPLTRFATSLPEILPGCQNSQKSLCCRVSLNSSEFFATKIKKIISYLKRKHLLSNLSVFSAAFGLNSCPVPLMKN